MPIFGAVAAIAAAFSTGANNLPSPFSTPIGSGSLTLLKAFEAAFASCGSFVNDLFSDFLKENQPSEGLLMWSMVVVVETAAIWLALATYLQLPVSPQQSMQGALLGTILVTEGFSYIPLRNKNANHNFNRGGLLWIFLERTVAPFIAFACVLFLFSVIPSTSAVHSRVTVVAVALAAMTGALLSLGLVIPLAMKKVNAAKIYKTVKRNMSKSINQKSTESQEQTCISTKSSDDGAQSEEALKDFLQMRVLGTVYEEEDERSWA
ncbi:hypothetical protein DVH24_011388 [Malus domestica]|uniref:Uncharacterized protein n=1 Tax=Malus domestica TaxID=3750 RepID=A0A498JYI2_MALDO|nr:hypothetical protein DVH24_011388 [Malus domestica]